MPWIALILAPLIAYAPLMRAGFIWDDDTTLTANPLVAAADGLHRIWFTTQAPDYWPITYSCLWLEHRLFGATALGYHLVGLALFVAACLILWRLLLALRVPGAFLAALLFALHPLNVESVAWIAQRKNLLALLCVFIGFRAFAASRVRARLAPDRWTWFAVLAGLAAMLCKGSAALYPLVLLGWLAWKRRPRAADAVWLLPSFAGTGVLTAVNLWFAHKSSAGEAIRHLTFADRIAGAGAAFWFYVGKAFCPLRPAFVYPGWTPDAARLVWWLPLAAALLLTVWLWRRRAGALRPELFGWAYFGVMLIPVLGLTDVYFMRYSPVADHYVQLALGGFCAWAAFRYAAAGGSGAVAALVLAGLGGLTAAEVRHYRDPETLFTWVLDRNPACWMAHNNLGTLLQSRGELTRAKTEYGRALALFPDYAEAHSNYGVLLQQTGRLDQAVPQYATAVRLDPRIAQFHNNYSTGLLATGQVGAAESEARRAVDLRPEYPEARLSLGNALRAAHQPARAEAQFEAALRVRPDSAATENALGAVLCDLGRGPEALAHLERAHALDPGSAQIAGNLALVRRTLAGISR